MIGFWKLIFVLFVLWKSYCLKSIFLKIKRFLRCLSNSEILRKCCETKIKGRLKTFCIHFLIISKIDFIYFENIVKKLYVACKKFSTRLSSTSLSPHTLSIQCSFFDCFAFSLSLSLSLIHTIAWIRGSINESTSYCYI